MLVRYSDSKQVSTVTVVIRQSSFRSYVLLIKARLFKIIKNKTPSYHIMYISLKLGQSVDDNAR